MPPLPRPAARATALPASGAMGTRNSACAATRAPTAPVTVMVLYPAPAPPALPGALAVLGAKAAPPATARATLATPARRAPPPPQIYSALLGPGATLARKPARPAGLAISRSLLQQALMHTAPFVAWASGATSQLQPRAPLAARGNTLPPRAPPLPAFAPSAAQGPGAGRRPPRHALRAGWGPSPLCRAPPAPPPASSAQLATGRGLKCPPPARPAPP